MSLHNPAILLDVAPMEIDTAAEVGTAKENVNESAEPVESTPQNPREFAESEDKSSKEGGQAVTAAKSIKVDSSQVTNLVPLERHTARA